MFDRKLFLGIRVEMSLKEILATKDEKFIKLFIQESSAYLQDYYLKDERYIGKSISSPFLYSDLSAMELNVKSLLQRFLPEYDSSNALLWLLPAVKIINKG